MASLREIPYPEQNLMLSVPPSTPAKQISLQTPAPSIPYRIYRAHSSHPHRKEPEGQPAAADLFTPTAVFEVAVWGEIPQLPWPILQLALVPASSHAGLSSPPTPSGPHPFPGDRSMQGSFGAGFWHREAQQSLILPQGAVGACPPWPSFLLPSDHPSFSPCQEHGALPRHVPGGCWSPNPAAPGQLLRAVWMGTSPCAPPPRHICTSAAAWDEVLTLAMANGPAGSAGALADEILPSVAQPAQPRPGHCWQRELWENYKDQDVDRTTPSQKPFPKAPPGVQLCLQAPQPLLSTPSSPGSSPRGRVLPAAACGAVPNLPRQQALPFAERRQAEVHTVKNCE